MLLTVLGGILSGKSTGYMEDPQHFSCLLNALDFAITKASNSHTHPRLEGL